MLVFWSLTFIVLWQQQTAISFFNCVSAFPLQAHLLSMSRDIAHTRHPRPPPQSSRHPIYFPTTGTHPPAPTKPAYNRALIERELMKGRLQGEDGGGYSGGHQAKQEEGSVFDTPNPRSQPPQPAQFGGGKGACSLCGLLFVVCACDVAVCLRMGALYVVSGIPGNKCINL